jgi:Na+-translocating ferredoxin:NAD+ oxidoreductase subunit B
MSLAETLTQRIFAALPQTQCTRCGFPDCQAYASAIVYDGKAINQCSPGGAEGIARLSQITGQAVQPLNPENGIEGPRSVAFIDENWCIGCTLCIDVCPTDAIIGSNKMMHTVIEPHCTGCELCIPVCPVDCIELENVTGELTGWAAWPKDKADAALERYTINRYKTNSDLGSKNVAPTILNKKSAVIEAALAKARAKRA